MKGLFGIYHKDAVVSRNQFAVGAFLGKVSDGGHGPQCPISVNILQVRYVHVGAECPESAVVASEQLGTAAALAVKEHHAISAPRRAAVSVDFHHPVLCFGCAEQAYHRAIGEGCKSIAGRPGGEVGRGDVNAIVAPLRNTGGVKVLQLGRPSVVRHAGPLYEGATIRGCCDSYFPSTAFAVGDESVGAGIVDPLGLQSGNSKQSCCE